MINLDGNIYIFTYIQHLVFSTSWWTAFSISLALVSLLTRSLFQSYTVGNVASLHIWLHHMAKVQNFLSSLTSIVFFNTGEVRFADHGL